MSFRFEKLTAKAQEAIVNAQSLASSKGHPEVTPIHLVSSLLNETDGIVRPLLEKMLQPDPANRPESMAAVAAWQVGSERPKEVRQISGSRQASSGGRAASTRGSGWGKKAALAAGVAVILLSGGGAGYYYLTQPDAVPPPRPPALGPVAARPSPPSQVARPAPDAPAALRPEPAPPSDRRQRSRVPRDRAPQGRVHDQRVSTW